MMNFHNFIADWGDGHEIDRVTTAYENRLDELTSAKVNADYADRSKDEIRKALVRTNERIDEERKANNT